MSSHKVDYSNEENVVPCAQDISHFLRSSQSGITSNTTNNISSAAGNEFVKGVLDEQLFSILLNRSGEKLFLNSSLDGNKGFLKWFNSGLDEFGALPFDYRKVDMTADQRVSEVPTVDNITFVPQDPQLEVPISIPVPQTNNTNKKRGSDQSKKRKTDLHNQASLNSHNGNVLVNAQGMEIAVVTDINPEEERAMKKKRRQEKNREAAQLFRQRQKARVLELERKVDELTISNNEYRTKMEVLAFENKILKDQLAYLRNLISGSIVMPNMPNLPTLPSGLSVPTLQASTQQDEVMDGCKKLAQM